MPRAGRLQVQVLMRSLNFFNLPGPCSHTGPWGLHKLLTEMSTRNFPGGKGSAAGRPPRPVMG
jgi:hypothetical protein